LKRLLDQISLEPRYQILLATQSKLDSNLGINKRGSKLALLVAVAEGKYRFFITASTEVG